MALCAFCIRARLCSMGITLGLAQLSRVLASLAPAGMDLLSSYKIPVLSSLYSGKDEPRGRGPHHLSSRESDIRYGVQSQPGGRK